MGRDSRILATNLLSLEARRKEMADCGKYKVYEPGEGPLVAIGKSTH